jgi:hypothetical protein
MPPGLDRAEGGFKPCKAFPEQSNTRLFPTAWIGRRPVGGVMRTVPKNRVEAESMGVKKSGKGRRKMGQKKRRMRAKIRHRKG